MGTQLVSHIICRAGWVHSWCLILPAVRDYTVGIPYYLPCGMGTQLVSHITCRAGWVHSWYLILPAVRDGYPKLLNAVLRDAEGPRSLRGRVGRWVFRALRRRLDHVAKVPGACACGRSIYFYLFWAINQ